MTSLHGAPLRHPEVLAAMGATLRHRGPARHRVKELRTAASGCERLRIVDLSERADQPIHDLRARRWLVCNGEIYNAPELRRRFPDYPYRSGSDAEVILPLFAEHGPAALRELDGMFAIAIWDEPTQTLVMARDRAGEKPLFYCEHGGELWFASELQALLEHPAISRNLDEDAIRQYLTLGYVPDPRTPFRDIRKIEAERGRSPRPPRQRRAHLPAREPRHPAGAAGGGRAASTPGLPDHAQPPGPRPPLLRPHGTSRTGGTGDEPPRVTGRQGSAAHVTAPPRGAQPDGPLSPPGPRLPG